MTDSISLTAVLTDLFFVFFCSRFDFPLRRFSIRLIL